MNPNHLTSLHGPRLSLDPRVTRSQRSSRHKEKYHRGFMEILRPSVVPRMLSGRYISRRSIR